MKNLLILLILGLASYGSYTIWSNHRNAAPPPKVATEKSEETDPVLNVEPTPAAALARKTVEPALPKVEPAPPMPAATAKRIVPEGVFYAVQAFSVMTEDGVRGIRAGTPLKLVKDAGATMRMTDGKEEFDAQREHLTNDLDRAAQAANIQTTHQAANAEWQQKQQALAATNQQQQAAATAASVDTAQKTIALNGLMAREKALNLEAAKIQASITTYENTSRRVGQYYYDQYGVRHVRVGDTHVNDLIALRQKLAGINSELTSIASRISQLQR